MTETMHLDDSLHDCAIADLGDDERSLLTEFAEVLRNRPTRTVVARSALDRVAQRLIRAAAH